MTSDLFRKEAIAHAARRIPGTVILATPLSMRILVLLVSVVLVAFVCFATLTTYTRKQTLQGWLTPKDGVARVIAQNGGLVERLTVREGQKVAQGEHIAYLSISTALKSGDYGDMALRSSTDQINAAGRSHRAILAKLEVERESLEAQVPYIDRAISGGITRLNLLKQKQVMARQRVDRLEKVADMQLISKNEFDTVRAAAMDAESEVSSAKAVIDDLSSRRAELIAKMLAIPEEIELANAQNATSAAELAIQSSDNESRNRYFATAGMAGQVAAIAVKAGQTVEAGATIAVITPGSSELEAQLFSPAGTRPFLRVGQEVRLTYQGISAQRYESGVGRIVSISGAALDPDDISVPGLSLDQSVFQVKVRLDKQSIMAYSEELPVQAGTLVSADIVVERMSLVRWLFDPLYAAARRH